MIKKKRMKNLNRAVRTVVRDGHCTISNAGANAGIGICIFCTYNLPKY